MAYNKSAEKGDMFVLTEKGYKNTPDMVKPERKIGNPVKGFRYRVPTAWVSKGYVEEVRENEID